MKKSDKSWFRVADLTDEQLERVREASLALIEQHACEGDPILCVISAYVAEMNEERKIMENHNVGMLN